MAIEKGWVEIPITKLVKAEWNYKTEDEEKSVKLLNNIKRNGQIENLIVREIPKGLFEVTNGNHRFDVFKKLQLKNAMCFNLGKVSQRAAERVAVETNETRFESDPFKFGEILKGLKLEFDMGELLQTVPFTQVDFDSYTTMIDFDFNAFNVTPPSATIDPNSSHVAITINVEKTAAIEFKALMSDIKRHLDPKNPEEVDETQCVEYIVNEVRRGLVI